MNFIQKLKDIVDKTNLDNSAFEGVFSLDGANCSSCRYAIEKVGVKFEGVSYCFVDIVKQEIHIHYDGRTSTEQKIEELVKQLGYFAKFINKNIREKQS